MKSTLIKTCFVITMMCITASLTYSGPWGFWGHKRVNRVAVFTLPTEMMGFFKNNLYYITQHAVDPDKRRYALENEAENHYIDIDYYGEYPYDELPRSWNEAVEKYSEDTLRAYGISPWNLQWYYKRLVKDFKSGNSKRILKTAADIGHYIGDIHVPLHTTLNYNGQLTDQKGIHGFWESRIPELKGEDYDYFVGKAEYIPDVEEWVWDIVMSSAVAVDSVLRIERELTEEFDPDMKYVYEERGLLLMKTYSREFSEAYDARLDNMIERRMRMTILNLGSLWYSAWIDAGSPDLMSLDSIEMTEEEKEAEKELEKKFQEGKIRGRSHDK